MSSVGVDVQRRACCWGGLGILLGWRSVLTRGIAVLGAVALGAGCGDAGADPATDAAPTDTDDPAGAVEGGVPVQLTLLPTAPCVEAARRFEHTTVPLSPVEFGFDRDLVGASVLVADLNGDGWDDLFAPGRGVHHLWWGGPDGFAQDDAALDGLDLSDASSASAVRLDEGLPYVLVTRYQAENRLIRFDGEAFVDHTASWGLGGTSWRHVAAAFGDMDRDGDLDLFIGTYGPRPADAFAHPDDFEAADPPLLYRNDGGRFTLVEDLFSGPITKSHTFSAAFLDLDDDGHPELYIVNDFGWVRPNLLLWNRPEGLVPDDGSAGLHIPFAGMGLGIGDLNDDLIPDLVQSSWRDASVLVSREGTWFEHARLRGVMPVLGPGYRQFFGWGTVMEDLNLNARLDIAMGFGEWDEWQSFPEQRDALYLQQPDGTFEDASEAYGFDAMGPTRGVVAADLNHDGHPDLVVRRFDEDLNLYLGTCTPRRWLTVRLQQPGPNPDAVGARVVVQASSGRQARWVVAGTAPLHAAGGPELRFGLNRAERVDALEVRWPDGEVSVLRDLDVDARLEIVRQPVP